MIPSQAFCVKGRDVVMGVTGALVVAGGVTFIIKSGSKKPTEPQTASIQLQPWFPMKDLQSHDFKKLP